MRMWRGAAAGPVEEGTISLARSDKRAPPTARSRPTQRPAGWLRRSRLPSAAADGSMPLVAGRFRLRPLARLCINCLDGRRRRRYSNGKSEMANGKFVAYYRVARIGKASQDSASKRSASQSRII